MRGIPQGGFGLASGGSDKGLKPDSHGASVNSPDLRLLAVGRFYS
jgi:hypothetical protein